MEDSSNADPAPSPAPAAAGAESLQSTIVVDPGFGLEIALDMLQKDQGLPRILSLCKPLDDLLDGGVACGEVTEFCGPPGIGKTQLAIQLACDVQLPAMYQGPEGQALYLDTEGSFVPERAHEIATHLVEHLKTLPNGAGRCASAEAVLGGIMVGRLHDETEHVASIRALPHFLRSQEPRVKLVIVDSIAFHLRYGSKDLVSRSRLLVELGGILQAVATQHQVAVVVLNHMTTRMDKTAGDDGAARGRLVPALGEIWSHQIGHRVMLDWRGDTRVASVLKSTYLRRDSAAFRVGSNGIRAVAQPRSSKRQAQRDAPAGGGS